jgi:hypothetical protein
MDQRQFEATLADAEIRLRRLRTLYDQWFHGLERMEPRTQRSDVDRLITELRRAQPRNTALRFRFNQLVQRYTTYNTYWQRITRQIEEGTYKRDVLRARRRFAGEPAEADRPRPDGYELDLDIDIEAALDAIKSEPPGSIPAAGRPSSRPPPASGRPLRAMREITPFALPSSPPPSAATPSLPSRPAASLNAPRAPQALGPRFTVPPPPPAALSRKPPPLPSPAARGASSIAASRPASQGVTDDQIQNIYRRYLDARKENRERTDNVKLETVAKTVRDMMPKLTQKHAGKQIDFEVVVKGGKVALKPVAK